MRFAPADLRGLTVFRTVVEHGGFAGAQLALGMSQSTISFHLKALEDRLGFELCQRGRKGFQLTERGRDVFEASKPLVGAISDFESRLGDLRHQIVGTLRVGIVDNTITDSAFRLDEVIGLCLKKTQESEIQLTVGHPEILIVELSKGGLDIVITPRVEFVAGFRETPFRTERHTLYCGVLHPLFSRTDSVPHDEIEKYDFVVRPYTGNKSLPFRQARIRAHASNMEAMAMFILSGQVLGYLPEHYAKSWVDAGRLRPIASDDASISSEFIILTNDHENPPYLQRLFINELISRFGKPQC